MHSDVKSRLISYLKYRGLSQKAFAESVGLSSGFVNAIRVSIQPKTLEKISAIYGDLNISWLLTGQGPMLTPHDSTPISIQAENSAVSTSGQAVNNIGGLTTPTPAHPCEGCPVVQRITDLEALVAEKERLISVLMSRT